MDQISLHKKIGALLLMSPNDATREDVSKLISANADTHQFFFAQANEQWLDWLWSNGFLDIIKAKAEDPSRYFYRTPELNYLSRVAEKAPNKVVEVMLATPISAETFNPEVIDQFTHICSDLPPVELARMAQKIRDGKWIPLMGKFNRWTFEYEKMLKALKDARDYKNLLTITEALLSVRPKEEVKKDKESLYENPFYFDDLSETNVFEILINLNDENAELGLGLATKAMAKIVLLGGKAKNNKEFPIEDGFHLYDVDFFTLESRYKKHLSYRDDVRELAKVIVTLTKRLIGKKCNNVRHVQKIYKKYIEPLPPSKTMWRLRLFVLSLCPTVFKGELKFAFFKLFETEHYFDITFGTEYEKALQIGFPVLSGKEKRDYVKRVIKYFSKHFKGNEEEEWHITYGSRILSMINKYLTKKEKQKISEHGFKLDPNYEPESTIGEIKGGTVVPRGPITQDEFGRLAIDEIALKLRNEWDPKNLKVQNTSDDFLRPLNAEGVGALLRFDMSKRLQEFIDKAGFFFELNVLDQHYTYSFLRGIQEILRGKKIDTNDINWANLITLFKSIKESGEGAPFDRTERSRERFNGWLASWDAVHSEMAEVIQELLSEKDEKICIDFSSYRNQLFSIIGYLLGYADPMPKDEKIKSAQSRTILPGTEEYIVSDPYTMAINSVRGRAFQAFVLFVYQDGKNFPKDAEEKIYPDAKKLYVNVLSAEKTRALMFLFGHYIPTFFYRDKTWILGLLPQIFPAKKDRANLYTAAWEGYLSSNLYKEIFIEPKIQKLYERGFGLTKASYPKQRHFKNPDEGVATHLALAFMHFDDFSFDHPLFKTFWEKGDAEKHAHFVSFIGRMFVSGDNARANQLLEKDPMSKNKLKDFWDWLLNNYIDSKPFIEFGFWVNLEKKIFEPKWLAEHVMKTLEKTKGILKWDVGLLETITQLSKDAPEDALAIARYYLLEGGVHGANRIMYPFMANKWIEAFKILYGNPATKTGTYNLIDELMREGRSPFWRLKEALK